MVIVFIFQDLTVNHQSDSAKIDRLREQVLSRQRAFEEEERVRHEEARRREEEERRREEEERREREVAEKTRREVEERVRKESRLEKIKRDQENAMKKARLENAMVMVIWIRILARVNALLQGQWGGGGGGGLVINWLVIQSWSVVGA